ncbi:hypothetical protein SAMN05421676_101483 [Salinibacillus kushneri]|uniref:Glycosyl transferase family 28 C-terminal domain-containing protein n=1 Tax=Salinibacillus kushneri TaxID=237682 RepID=A0A1H9ZEH1_9BACI|nr:hypothetical protein [Salinibacillus kushneri]SES79974.1 hypothetical protein SAMN05421676_101483 [Salinibacillus kushneri]
MDDFISLAVSDEPDWGKSRSTGFIARQTDPEQVDQIINTVNPNRDKTIVYFGLGMKIDIEKLDKLPIWNSEDCVFLVSSNMKINKQNVFKVPLNYTESQNYIAASDIVISKAGWSKVSEAVVNRKSLLVLDRNELNEDRNTIEFLKGINHVRLVSWGELLGVEVDSGLIQELRMQDIGQWGNEVQRVTRDIIKVINH